MKPLSLLLLILVMPFFIPVSALAQTYYAPQPVYQTQPQPDFVQSVPQVIPLAATPSGKIKELPRTGPSIWVYVLAGLLPIGLFLKNYGALKVNKNSANSIWKNRSSQKNTIT